MRGGVTDAGQTTNERTNERTNIEDRATQPKWKLEAEFRNCNKLSIVYANGTVINLAQPWDEKVSESLFYKLKETLSEHFHFYC